MSLETRITAVLQAIGADVKLLRKPKYRFGFFCVGKPVASEVFGPFYPDAAFTIPAEPNTTSIGKAKASFTSSSTWTIQRGGVAILNVAFTAGASTAVITNISGALLNIARGDPLELVAPSTVDSTGSGIGVTIVGTLA